MATRRPNLWSYVSFSLSNSRVGSPRSLPTHNGESGDPYEKLDRHTNGRSSPSMAPHTSSRQRSRAPWKLVAARIRALRWLGAVFFIAAAVYFFLPKERVRRNILVGDQPPLSPNKDLDPSVVTPRCSKPYDSSKPLIQYALMIDAGSTGSRIHVYRFNNCGPTPELEREFFKQTQPQEGGAGLSSYDADDQGAAQSLDELLNAAIWNVPEPYRSCSPVAVKATAGLRRLGSEKSEKILRAVRYRLETKYPFPVLAEDKGGVEVMDGKDEGVYAWITTNYLLGNIGSPEKKPTAAVFDLGGGSTQIVFQPTFPDATDGGMPQTLQEGDHKYDLQFGGQNFSLYQHSYLGYGLMAARQNLHQLIVHSAHETSPSDRSWLDEPLENPCIIPGTSKTVDVEMPEDHPLGPTVKATMKGPSTASHDKCLALAEKTLNKDFECSLTPCAFNGVHQPSLAETFAREDIYLFSYFYDRMEPLGMPSSFTLQEMKDLTSKVCAGQSGWQAFEGIQGALAELQERPEYCLDLSFMLALLVKGYEMPLERQVKIAKKILGNELGWCLGASLPLLNQKSGWTCRVKEVA